jgi:hypothetical protein
MQQMNTEPGFFPYRSMPSGGALIMRPLGARAFGARAAAEAKRIATNFRNFAEAAAHERMRGLE